MEMSNFLPDLHVAQQSRREKLRVPSTSTSAPPQQPPHEHFDDDLLPPPGGPPLALPLDSMMNYGTTPPNTTTIHHPARFAVPTSCENWAIPCYVDYENDQDQRRMFPQGIFNNNNELPLLPSFVGGNNETSTPQAGSLSLTLSSNQIRQPEPGTISSVVDQMVSRIRGGGEGGGNQQAQDTAQLYRNVGPLGPFTGYTTILRNSKFLKPAQLLLDEFLNAAGLRINIMKECEVEAESSNINNGGSKSRCSVTNDQLSSGGSGSCESYKPDCHEKKAKLLHMQEEEVPAYTCVWTCDYEG